MGDKLVGTSAYSLHPKEAQDLPIVGNYIDPNIEKILSLKPSLVVGEDFNQKAQDKLKHFNIKTLTLKLKTITDIKNSIDKLAKNIDSKEAKRLIKDIDDAIEKIPKNKSPHSVMIVYGLKEDLSSATYIAGRDIFFNDIIKLCANTNAYTANSNKQPVLSYENIIALNPDQIIILHSLATESGVDVEKALKAWHKLPTNASKNKNISVVDDDYLHIPSHRIALTIKRLSDEMQNYKEEQ
ncbi:MAG: helical backbone metal receptor [Sulfurimonas sp.]|nr:helical backbone metal receptor [Sulfurimonas sp.]